MMRYLPIPVYFGSQTSRHSRLNEIWHFVAPRSVVRVYNYGHLHFKPILLLINNNLFKMGSRSMR